MGREGGGEKEGGREREIINSTPKAPALQCEDSLLQRNEKSQHNGIARS